MKTAVLTLALTLVLQGAGACPSEVEPAWSMDEEGIKVELWAPGEAYPGDNINLTLKVKATENVTSLYVAIRLQAPGSWETYLHPMENEELAGEESRLRNCSFSVPADVLPGAVSVHVYCSWKVYRSHVWRDRSYEESFQAVYLRNRGFEQLQLSYADLNTTYQQLQQSYADLNTTYADLNNTHQSILSDLEELQSRYEGVESSVSGTRNLSYCLVAISLVFAGLTGFLLVTNKKEKKQTEQQTEA